MDSVESSGNTVTVSGKDNISNVGQHINITLPDSGYQKIIKPDGSVELQSVSPTASIPSVDNLNQRIEYLEKLILEKDRLIETKDNMIELLQKILDKQ